MKAIRKLDSQSELQLCETEVPAVGANDVLIKVKQAAICGTDLHIDKWDAWASATLKPPLTIGHEFVGTVEAIGSEVHSVKVGQRVSAEGHVVCGNCWHCRSGKAHLCIHTKTLGYNGLDGVFAEYVRVPKENVWVCEEGISDDEYACFDPYGNAVHAVNEWEIFQRDVLITGAGPIGLMAGLICKQLGARNIVITELADYRLDLAKKLNFGRVVDIRKESLSDVMQELEIHSGFDVGLEMSGVIPALNSMIDVMNNGGGISLMGILPKEGEGIDWVKVVFNCLTLKGICGRKIFDTWFEATDLIRSGLDLNPLITHRFKFEDFRKAFDLMHKGQTGKVILEW